MVSLHAPSSRGTALRPARRHHSRRRYRATVIRPTQRQHSIPNDPRSGNSQAHDPRARARRCSFFRRLRARRDPDRALDCPRSGRFTPKTADASEIPDLRRTSALATSPSSETSQPSPSSFGSTPDSQSPSGSSDGDAKTFVAGNSAELGSFRSTGSSSSARASLVTSFASAEFVISSSSGESQTAGRASISS